MSPLTIIIVMGFVFFIIYLILHYTYFRYENMTGEEIKTILPILYDSSVPNKQKITDLLGIVVNDDEYNNILKAKTTDSDIIINNIKSFIEKSVSFVGGGGATPATPSPSSTPPATQTVTSPPPPPPPPSTPSTTQTIPEIPKLQFRSG